MSFHHQESPPDPPCPRTQPTSHPIAQPPSLRRTFSPTLPLHISLPPSQTRPSFLMPVVPTAFFSSGNSAPQILSAPLHPSSCRQTSWLKCDYHTHHHAQKFPMASCCLAPRCPVESADMPEALPSLHCHLYPAEDVSTSFLSVPLHFFFVPFLCHCSLPLRAPLHNSQASFLSRLDVRIHHPLRGVFLD